MSDTSNTLPDLTAPNGLSLNVLTMIARLVAGAPLLFFGIQKFISSDVQENFRVTLELSLFPMPGILMWIAAAVEVVAGAMLLLGLITRLGGLLATLQMFAAIIVHITVDFSQTPAGGPPHWLPVLVLFAALVTLVFAGGDWSIDRFIVKRLNLPAASPEQPSSDAQ